MRALSKRHVIACAVVLVVAVLGLAGQAKRLSVAASCPPGCQPTPTAFQVPGGSMARGFAIQSLTAGKACVGTSGQIKGFSIRRSGQTVLVFYFGSSGPVSDPLPLEDLELAQGTYHLFAAPAAGASVTLTYQLTPR